MRHGGRGTVATKQDPRGQCLGKVRHASRGAAERAVRNAPRAGLAPYKCPHCRHWHIGHGYGAALKRQFLG